MGDNFDRRDLLRRGGDEAIAARVVSKVSCEGHAPMEGKLILAARGGLPLLLRLGVIPHCNADKLFGTCGVLKRLLAVLSEGSFASRPVRKSTASFGRLHAPLSLASVLEAAVLTLLVVALGLSELSALGRSSLLPLRRLGRPPMLGSAASESELGPAEGESSEGPEDEAASDPSRSRRGRSEQLEAAPVSNFLTSASR